MKNKCEYIELCRFVGAIIILCHHSYTLMDRTIFLGGWAFVEFYFILTGYYTTSHFVKKMEKHKVEYDEMFFYVKSKIKKLYPYAVGGVLFSFLNVITKCSENDRGVASFSLIYNLLLLKGSDIANSSYTYDPPLWYITHLILFLPLIIILMVKNEKIYKYFLCWFIPIMLYALCMDYMKKIAIWEGGIFQCFRGIAGLTVGSALFYMTRYYKEKDDFPKMLFRIASVIGFIGFIFITVFFRNGGIDISAEIIAYLIIVMFFTLMNDENYIKNKHIYSICIHLGELALPIYCIHYPIQDWIQRLFPLNGYWLKLGMSIVWSVMISELKLLVCKKWGEQKRIVQKETTL